MTGPRRPESLPSRMIRDAYLSAVVIRSSCGTISVTSRRREASDRGNDVFGDPMLAARDSAADACRDVLAQIERVRRLPLGDECLEVRSGAEGPARAREHADMDSVILREIAPRVPQLIVELVIERVEPSGLFSVMYAILFRFS